jgi:hypothetical protein
MTGRPPLPWYLAPKVELARFAPIDFFPSRPGNMQGIPFLCLGTKSRTIGDALMLTTLPAKIRAKHPSIEIYSYPRGFNPVVMFGNPHVKGIRYMPRKVYGDDINWGGGHLIQLKERFFELEIGDRPRPELHLLEREKRWAERYLKVFAKGARALPVCVIHPWGQTVRSVATINFWTSLVRRWSHSYSFIQVGVAGHDSVPGCERHLLTPRAYRHARKVFALMSRAQLFIGVNSGPMHVARAFDIPSIVLTQEGEIDTIFRMRRQAPYFLYHNWKHSFLYEENLHIDVAPLSEEQLLKRLDTELERMHPSTRR